jgi:ABC-type glycerol-3-phosphate transport system substrate-binding protein
MTPSSTPTPHLFPTLPRRGFLGLLGAGAGAVMLGGTAACGGDGGGAGDGEFDVWVLLDENVNSVSQASLDRFNQSSEVKGRLVTEPNEGYRDAVQIAIDTAQRPDIFFNWGGGSIRSYARAGLLEDLTPQLAAEPAFKSAFLPSVLDAGQIDGRYYGIPMRQMQPKLMFYNTAVLADVGVAVPTTWQEFLSACDTIRAAGITPVALAGAVSWTELMWIEYLTDRIGGAQVFRDIAAGAGQGWRHPAITEAVNTIAELVDRGVFGTNFPSVQYEAGGAETLLEQGEAAMHLMGSWSYTNHLGAAPEFASQQLAWGPFPSIEGGAGDPRAVAGNPTNYFSVTSASPHKQVAIDYLRQEMASDAYVRGLIGIGDTPAVADIEPLLADTDHADYLSFVYQMVVQAPSFQLSWDQAIERVQASTMLEALAEVFLGNLDAAGFVQANEDAAG